MPTNSIAFDLAGAFFIIAIATANVVTFAMIRRINEIVPETERESYLSRGSWRYRSKFRNLFPNDRLLQVHDISLACMLLGFIALWLTLG